MISERFVWPNMKKDITNWVDSCIPCQNSKISRHNKATLANFNVPDARFRHINIDLVGPLKVSNGFRYALTCIDRFSRWPVAMPLEDMEAKTVANALISSWISHYGVPETITTDQGRQFESKLFAELTKLTGTRHTRSAARHPQANGIIERFHRTMKAAIKCYESENWSEVLPLVLLGLRTTFKDDLNATPAEMLYGTTLTLKNSEVDTEFAKNLRNIMEQLEVFRAKGAQRLHTCTHVFLRDGTVRPPLKQPYDEPYEVISRNNKNFDLNIKGKIVKVTIDRVKAAF